MCRRTTACDSMRTQLPPLVVAFLKLATFAYVTDTTASGDYLDFIDRVDVMIGECCFPDDMAEDLQELQL